MGKQAYKIKLSKKWKTYDVFHVSLLKQDTTRKRRVETAIELDKDDSKEYELEVICDCEVYTKELDSDHYLPGLYYLILWKSYLKEENIWEPASTIQYLWKLITIFHRNYLDKLIVTSLPIDSALPIAWSIIKPRAKVSKKHGRLAKTNSTSKRAKKSWNASFLSYFGPISIANKKSPQSHNLCSAPLRLQFDFLIFFTLWDSPSHFGFCS